MFASQLGIRLVLWTGKTVPTPAPPEVLRALTQVEVRQEADGDSGLRMTFTLGKGKSGEYGLLGSGALDPDTRVVVGVVLGAVPEPLIDAVIYHHQVMPRAEPGQSTLTVMGRDVSVMLDLEEKDEPHKNLSDSAIVLKILAQYGQYVMPPYQVTTTTYVPIEQVQVSHQRETDLRFLKRLARRNGFIFYLEPLAMGVNSAYWGPDTRLGPLLPALRTNAGSATNVTELRFANDALAPVGTQGAFMDPITKRSIKIPPLPSLRMPPLARSAGGVRRIRRLRGTARQGPALAALTAVAAVTGAEDPVSATGELETLRYGAVLRPRRLVGVQGAGLSYDGNYSVSRVTHTIEPGKYVQQFELSREGTGALAPAVRP